jgi:ketosteroid isomerase-like protein
MEVGKVAALGSIRDSLNRRDLDAVLEKLDPQFEADYSRSINPDNQGIYRGRDEVRALLQRMVEPWEGFEYTMDEFIEIGDDVITVGALRVRGAGSGVETEARGAQVWEFRGGHPVAVRQFQSKEEALDFAGSGN